LFQPDTEQSQKRNSFFS